MAAQLESADSEAGYDTFRTVRLIDEFIKTESNLQLPLHYAETNKL